MKSCREINSEKDGWRYILWTDENIEYTVSIKSIRFYSLSCSTFNSFFYFFCDWLVNFFHYLSTEISSILKILHMNLTNEVIFFVMRYTIILNSENQTFLVVDVCNEMWNWNDLLIFSWIVLGPLFLWWCLCRCWYILFEIVFSTSWVCYNWRICRIWKWKETWWSRCYWSSW